MKPNSGIKILHNRHVHPIGFHLLIFFFKFAQVRGVFYISRDQLPCFWTSIVERFRSPINCSIISRFPYFFCSKRVSGNLFLEYLFHNFRGEIIL